jgi:hypothetical protein
MENKMESSTAKPSILYFYKGNAMTERDRSEVAKLQPFAIVGIHNASLAAGQKCDGVAGAVPASYKSFLKAKDAIANFVAPAEVVALPTPAEPKAATSFSTPVVPAVTPPKEF